MTFQSTRQVAKSLNVPVTRLSQAVWRGSIAEPERGPDGSFLWTAEDAQRAARSFGVKLNEGVSNV